MSPGADEQIRRILVALDASPESLAALDLAAELAAGLEAELGGLFVENVDLLNLASLPFAREASQIVPVGRELDPERMAAELRAQASLARRALEAAAAGFNLRYSFQVVRGQVEAEIATAVTERDLLTLGRGERSVRRKSLGRTLLTISTQLPCSVLLAVAVRPAATAPVAVVYDISDCGAGALSLAVRIAQQTRRMLLVYLMAENDADFAQKREHASARLAGRDIRVRYAHVRGYAAGDLEPALRSDDPHLLVVGCDLAGGMPPEKWTELASRAQCPVLLVRGLL
jgi:nucleotide-binding universal stress UspA family protein